MSHFAFVDNNVLRKNLDIAFSHIVELLTISESDLYKNQSVLVSSFRKTIIILTASIIEALLLWKLKQKFKSKEVELSNEWKYSEIKILYTINKSREEIVGGRRRKEKKEIDRLDFVRIIDICFKYNIVKKPFFAELNKVRELRNRLHIGGLKVVEKEYTREELKFVFGVLKKTRLLLTK